VAADVAFLTTPSLFMNTRIVLKWSIPLILIIGGVLAALFAGLPNFSSYHSDPDAIRPWAAEDWTRHTTDASAPKPTAAQFFSGLRFEVGSDEFKIQLRGRMDVWPYQLTDEGAVSLEALGVAPPIPPTSSQDQDIYQVPLHYYDASGTMELGDEKVRAPLIHRETLYSHGMWTGLNLILKKDEPCHVEGVAILDSRTHCRLTYGKGSRNEETHASVSVFPQTWRPGGMIASVDYTAGGHSWKPLRVGEGATVQEKGIHAQVLGLMEGYNARHSPSFHQNGTSTTAHYSLNAVKGTKEWRSAILIACFPYGDDAELDFRLYDEAGEELDSHTQGVNHTGFLVTTKQEIAEVARIEAGFPNRYERQILELPLIPMMPKENDLAEDMLEIRVPYMRVFQHEQALRATQIAQIRYERDGVFASPAELRWTEFENATAREILQSYGYTTRRGTTFSYNETDHILVGRGSRGHSWWRRLWPF